MSIEFSGVLTDASTQKALYFACVTLFYQNWKVGLFTSKKKEERRPRKILSTLQEDNHQTAECMTFYKANDWILSVDPCYLKK